MKAFFNMTNILYAVWAAFSHCRVGFRSFEIIIPRFLLDVVVIYWMCWPELEFSMK